MRLTLENETYRTLTQRDAHLVPGRLDTFVSGNGHDTFLDTKPYVGAFVDEPQEDWEALETSATSPALSEIAHRRGLEIRLIRLLVEQQTGDVDHSEQIDEIESEIYPHYSEEMFYRAVLHKIKDLERLELPQHIAGLEESRALLIEELESLLPGDYSEKRLDNGPDDQTIPSVQDWLISQFGDVFEEMPFNDKKTLTSLEMKDIVDIAISSTPSLRNAGWRCEIIDRQKLAISVYADKRTIVIPLKREVKSSDVPRLIIHEVFGHALRSALATEAGDVIGEQGTATYQSFEESFEIVLEQCLLGSYDDQRGVNHYIAIGMSKTGHKTKAEIAHMFESIAQLKQAEKTKTSLDDKAYTAATKSMQVQIRRTFAGQTDVDDGIPHMKDIDYFHGTEGAWALLNEIVKKGIVDVGMRWLLSAKFNPFSSQDRQHVEQFHPMPKELAPFFLT